MLLKDRLSALLARFPLNAGPAGRSELFSTLTLEPAPPLEAGQLHLLLRGSLQIGCLEPSPGSGPGSETAPPLQLLQPALVWWPAPAAHTLTPMSDRGATVLSVPVRFGPAGLNPLLDALPSRLVLLRSEMTGPLATLWDLMAREADDSSCGQDVVLPRLGEALLVQVLRQVLDEARGRSGLLGTLSDPRLLLVLDAIHARPHEPWTLELLAGSAGLSRTALATTFTQAMGVTLGDYMTDWRLRLARVLLGQKRAVKDVAAAVGYRSPAALTRVFQARLGASPSAWREAQASMHDTGP